MDICRTERQAPRSISIAVEDAETDPVLATAAGQAREPEMDRLSNIIAGRRRPPNQPAPGPTDMQGASGEVPEEDALAGGNDNMR